eukprot:3744833-Rhodomonas_salina.1
MYAVQCVVLRQSALRSVRYGDQSRVWYKVLSEGGCGTERVRGTELAYRVVPALQASSPANNSSRRTTPPMPLRVCYAVSGTDEAYAATSSHRPVKPGYWHRTPYGPTHLLCYVRRVKQARRDIPAPNLKPARSTFKVRPQIFKSFTLVT